jgi:hypothetical protein
MKGISGGVELKPHKRSSRSRSSERGFTVLIASLSLFCLVGMAALAIDISHLYLAGTELQNAADAAALAGASALDGTAGGVTAAVERALNTLNKYEFGSTDIAVTRSNVKFAVNLAEFTIGAGRDEATASGNPKNIRFIKVSLPPQPVSILFAIFTLNSNRVDLTRSAVAGLSVNGLNGDSSLNTLCNWVPLAVVQDPVTRAPLTVNPECPSKIVFTPGCTYTLRASSNNNGSVLPGNYQALSVFSDTGDADLRTRIGQGIHRCIHPGDLVSPEPGANAVTIRQAINARFGDYDSSIKAGDIPPDTNVKTNITYTQYRSDLPQHIQAPTSPGKPFQRVVILPIVNLNEFAARHKAVRILDFAPFFLRDKASGGNGGEIQVEYIGSGFPIGEAYYDPTYTGSGNGAIRTIAVPVLYH